IVFNNTISGTTTTSVRNKAGMPVEYTFQLTVSNTFKGPGGSFTHMQPVITVYGPDLLDASGEPGDNITYGPDLLFDDLSGSRNINTTLSPYIGTGDVIIEYSINGGVISLDGGLNYEFEVTTIYSGTFSLTYYWCPASPLNNNIRNFAAYNKDGLVHLSWFGADEIPGVTYELEISKDGRNFTRFSTIQTGSFSNGYHTEYYQPETGSGELYFRIKRIDPSGKVEYSPVKTVQFSEGGLVYEIYPNPAVKGVKLTFDHIIRGNMEVELLNTTGQRVFQKKYFIDNQPHLTVEWIRQPPPGIYYLRAIDLNNGRQTTRRLVIK
ncbi:MAG TPA: T9SS type A sorting domain-containing protein, partial [Parasegetibacter sp.]